MSHHGEGAIVVSFHGVRGSTPCCGPDLQRYGGNTSCVVLESPERAPIVFDLGTGLRQWGMDLLGTRDLTVHALVTHLHWDHVQGLPFFAPIHEPDTVLHVYGVGDAGDTMAETFCRFMTPPFFPVESHHLIGEVVFHDVDASDFEIEDAAIMARAVPHVGRTNGYRVERGGVSVAYVSDHQQPIDRPDHVADSVLELCAGVDLLIHDAQYTPEQFEQRSHWGHCTIEYAVEVARQAEVGTLVLFHHDPAHGDDEMDRLQAHGVQLGAAAGLQAVIAAAEGMKIPLGAPVR